MNKLNDEHPDKIPDYLAALDVAREVAAPAEEALPPLPPPAAPASAASAGSASGGLGHWLYFRCVNAVKEKEYTISALQLAHMVLDVMKDITESGEYDELDIESIGVTSYFFRAFGKVCKSRDMGFIWELEEKLPQMLNDMTLTKQNLSDAYPEEC